MTRILLLLVLLLILLVASGALLRFRDQRAEQAAWAQLLTLAPPTLATFSKNLLDGLPEPAQRYFLYTISEGAPLHNAVQITMTGELGLGTAAEPKYQPMQAKQLLVPPYGLVWKVRTGVLSGSDALTPHTSWTRFRLLGLLPVVRAGGNSDHYRSAFGRVVAEAAFWAPASLLPSESVNWQPVDSNTARATVSFNNFIQPVDITVDPEGQPLRVLIPRWSNENPDRTFRVQPFGGEPAEYRAFEGYRLPTRVTGGNHFGTADYFPFFRAIVSDIHFSARNASR